QVTTVQAGEAARDRKAEARARPERAAAPLPELLEDALLILRVDAGTRVEHADAQAALGHRRPHQDAPTGRRELLGVRQEVEHDLTDLALIADHDADT